MNDLSHFLSLSNEKNIKSIHLKIYDTVIKSAKKTFSKFSTLFS